MVLPPASWAAIEPTTVQARRLMAEWGAFSSGSGPCDTRLVSDDRRSRHAGATPAGAPGARPRLARCGSRTTAVQRSWSRRLSDPVNQCSCLAALPGRCHANSGSHAVEDGPCVACRRDGSGAAAGANPAREERVDEPPVRRRTRRCGDPADVLAFLGKVSDRRLQCGACET